MSNKSNYVPKYWKSSNNQKITCQEKLKILNDNLLDLEELIIEIYDEALLMGVDKKQIETIMKSVVSCINTDKKSEQ